MLDPKVEGVGYFDTLFQSLDIEVFARAIKSLYLTQGITQDATEGQVLNAFVIQLMKVLDYETFKQVAPQLFIYQNQEKAPYLVERLEATKGNYDCLKQDIDVLLVADCEVD